MQYCHNANNNVIHTMKNLLYTHWTLLFHHGRPVWWSAPKMPTLWCPGSRYWYPLGARRARSTLPSCVWWQVSPGAFQRSPGASTTPQSSGDTPPCRPCAKRMALAPQTPSSSCRHETGARSTHTDVPSRRMARSTGPKLSPTAAGTDTAVPPFWTHMPVYQWCYELFLLSISGCVVFVYQEAIWLISISTERFHINFFFYWNTELYDNPLHQYLYI